MKAEKELADVTVLFHEKVLLFRCIEHFITTDEFKEIFIRANEHERLKMRIWMLDGNYKALREWITANRQTYMPIEHWSLAMLREYSSKHKVKNYGTVLKGTLIKMVIDDLKERESK